MAPASQASQLPQSYCDILLFLKSMRHPARPRRAWLTRVKTNGIWPTLDNPGW